jgi:hypothetical protein
MKLEKKSIRKNKIKILSQLLLTCKTYDPSYEIMITSCKVNKKKLWNFISNRSNVES